MPVVRIDDEVWDWLKHQAEPLLDTPNSVLRRVAGLDPSVARTNRKRGQRMSYRTGSGRELNRRYGIGAKHALFRENGNWYHHLHSFPGVLFDANGYVLFQTENEYLTSPDLQHGETLHVPGGVASLSEYVRFSE